MKKIFIFLFFFVNIYLIPSSNNVSIFYNPTISKSYSNPINYKIIILSDSISINLLNQQNDIMQIGPGSSSNSEQSQFSVAVWAQPNNNSSTSEDVSCVEGCNNLRYQFNCSVVHHYNKLYYESYALSQDFFSFIDNSNNKYLIIENKLYKNISENTKEIYTLIKNLNFSYIDYIITKSEQKHEDTIIYGKQNKSIVFYNISSDSFTHSEPFEFNTSISCKLLEENFLICIYSYNNQIKFSILNVFNKNKTFPTHIHDESNNNFILNISEPILYDTDIFNFKILCGIKNVTKDNNDDYNDNVNSIKCFGVNVTFHKISGENHYEIKFDNISDINATFSFNDNNCNYTIFKSEYLICCGNKDKIICERRDMNLSLISIFNLEHYKNIKNLTLKNNNDTYIELRYYDERLEDKNISEYRIYPPKCINKNISLIGNKSSVIDLDSLFVRKTNSNYYLHFNHIDDMKLNISINDEYMKTLNETHKLKYNDKKLHIEIKNIEENKKMDIEYTISIEEKYSDLCTISFNFTPYYHSCRDCILSVLDSNIDNHNCISCNENYFPFKEKYLNCYSEVELKERNISFYFDDDTKIFIPCNPKCKTCYGPDENNCLSCINEYLFIYNGKCFEECPIGTIMSNNEINTCVECNIDCLNAQNEYTTWGKWPIISTQDNLIPEIQSTELIINNTLFKIETSSLVIESNINDKELSEQNMVLTTSKNELIAPTTNDLENQVTIPKIDISTTEIKTSINETEYNISYNTMNITDIIREETTNNNITEYTTQMMETSTQNNGIIYSQIENST